MALMHKNVADEQHMIAKDTFGGVSLPMRIHEMLEGAEPDEIDLIGLCTDICVISKRASRQGVLPPKPRSPLTPGPCAGATPEGHKTALSAMKACHIDIVNE